ncbi:MAG: aldo/keto reductase [Nitrospira sp.]|nr:aldo/keto reductase [Nitrospira sp.]
MEIFSGRELTVQYRRLGNTDLTPSLLGFGCSMIASLATRHSRGEVEATLRAARDAGVTFFDTADVYGQGDSERLLGRLYRERGKGMILCTKAGLTVGPIEGLVRMVKPVLNGLMRRWSSARSAATQRRRHQERQCFAPDYLRRRIEGSIRRLGVDRLDLFLLHNPPVDLPERDDVFELLLRLKASGTLRHIGVSCGSLEDADVWVTQAHVACVQVPLDRSRMALARPFLERAGALGVGVIAREILSRDALALGSISDAFRPLLERQEIGVMLAGMGCRTHLRENLGAIDESLRCVHVA